MSGARTIVHYTDSQGFGGAERALLHLLAGLDRRRWQPVLYYHPSAGIAGFLAEAHSLEVRLRALPPMPLGWIGATRTLRFAAALRRDRPAIFHAHLTWPLACKYGLVAALMVGVPGVVATAQLFVDLPYGRSTRLQQRLLVSRLGCYIAVSQHVAHRLRTTFGIPERRLRVVHNAVPVAPFERPADAGLRAQLAGPSKRPIILTCARLDPQKGLTTLLEAARLIPAAVFVIAGEGQMQGALRDQTRRLGLGDRIVFLGYREDVPSLLASCDVFVLPSLYEGLPLAVLEALAAGRPVVTTAIGGTDEVICDGLTGLLVPPNDPTALAAAIGRVLDEPLLATRLAVAGKARVAAQFSTERMVHRITETYDDLLDRSQARPRHA
jgi:glycosyltransferase involved in cell wall biosynthesis